MYLINQNNSFMQPNDVNNSHHLHLISSSNQCNNHLNNHININNHLLLHNHVSNHHSNGHLNGHQINNHNHVNSHVNVQVNHANNHHHLNNHLNSQAPSSNLNNNNSASFNCITGNKSTTSLQPLIHHSASNLTSANSGQPLCYNCKNHAHHTSVNKLSNSNTSLTTSSTNIYNQKKLEQSLIEAKLRVAQLKKELQSSKQQSNTSNNNNNQYYGGEDQVDFAFMNGGRESQMINQMIDNYMNAVGSQSNSRHSSQLALPQIKSQGLSSSSISTDSLRNSSSSVHLNGHHSYLSCNHKVSTSDCIAENIYSNQHIININKSRSANPLLKSSGNVSSTNVSNSNLNDRTAELKKARQRVIQMKNDLEANSENYVIYSNQSVILAQQNQQQQQQQQLQKQLDLNQKTVENQSNQQSPVDESFNLLTIIDKYYRTDSQAVEV